MSPDTQCEYGRCGGLGGREVQRRRVARLLVTVDETPYRVCESCADLLTRERRQRGHVVTRERLS